ncbi:MAG: Gfo/Idh/MocA family protein [Thermomicrobiales bacterium]
MARSEGLRVGLAGLGRFGKLHAAVLGGMPDIELAAVCDPQAEDVTAMIARYPKALGFDAFETMLDNSDLDAVFIVTPEPLHPEQAIAALSRGIATFVEKPLAMTSIEGARVEAAASAAGAPLQIGFVLRFDLQHALLRSEVSSGELGQVVSLRAKRNVSRAWFPDYGDRAHPIYETAIHDIDLLLWYVASPVARVQAVERNLSGMSYPDGCWALLEFANGAVGLLETSWFVPKGAPANVLTPTWRGTIDAEIEVIGTDGTGRIRLLDSPLSLWTAGFTAAPETGLWPEVGGAIGGALREEDWHFIDRVRRGAPETIASVADAVAGLRVAEAIVASAASGSAVELEASR